MTIGDWVYGCDGAGMHPPGENMIGKSSPKGFEIAKTPWVSFAPDGLTAFWGDVAVTVKVAELVGSLFVICIIVTR